MNVAYGANATVSVATSWTWKGRLIMLQFASAIIGIIALCVLAGQTAILLDRRALRRRLRTSRIGL